MDFGDVLKQAWSDVQAADLPEDLQALALKEALRHYLGTASTPRRTAPPSSPTVTIPSKPSENGDAPAVDTGDFLQKIAHGSGVDATLLEDILTLVDGKIHVLLPRRVFKGTVISDARTVMTVVAGARRWGLDERTTDIEIVREVLQDLDLYDSKNFKSKHVTEVPGTNYIKAQGVLQAKGDLHQKFAEAAQKLYDAMNA